MPFKIKSSDDRCPVGKPYAVVNSDTDKLHGCHPTKDAARQQQKALYANVPDAKSLRDPSQDAEAAEQDVVAAVSELNDVLSSAVSQIDAIDRVGAGPEVDQLCNLVIEAGQGMANLMTCIDQAAGAEPDEGAELDLYDRAMGLPYIVIFDYRSDSGPMMVGPFPSRTAGDDYVHDLILPDASWECVPISKP